MKEEKIEKFYKVSRNRLETWCLNTTNNIQKYPVRDHFSRVCLQGIFYYMSINILSFVKILHFIDVE